MDSCATADRDHISVHKSALLCIFYALCFLYSHSGLPTWPIATADSQGIGPFMEAVPLELERPLGEVGHT